MSGAYTIIESRRSAEATVVRRRRRKPADYSKIDTGGGLKAADDWQFIHIVKGTVRVLLVHHADAVGPGVDPQRPLSTLGRHQAAELADIVAGLEFRPAVIWHSGKLRSRETAEAFLRVCAPFAEFRMIRGLHPDDPPEWLRDELLAEQRDVLLVGHMPHIARLTDLLSRGIAAMPLHGMVGFEKSEDGTWRVFSEPRTPSQS